MLQENRLIYGAHLAACKHSLSCLRQSNKLRSSLILHCYINRKLDFNQVANKFFLQNHVNNNLNIRTEEMSQAKMMSKVLLLSLALIVLVGFVASQDPGDPQGSSDDGAAARMPVSEEERIVTLFDANSDYRKFLQENAPRLGL